MAYTEVCYKILSEVYRDGAYLSIALNRNLKNEPEAALITKIVKGVVEKNNELDFVISKLTKTPPKAAALVLLKQGIYCLKYMDSLPDYAVINNIVEFSKKIGKGGVSGFLNATLKAAAKNDVALVPDKSDKAAYYSVKYGKPYWLVQKIFNEYNDDDAEKILTAKPRPETHIRINTLKYTSEDFENYANKHNLTFKKSDVGGYFVKIGNIIKELFDSGRITYQSLTSMYAVKALNPSNRSNILDICAAPGGKAVYLAELDRAGTVTACDIHEHRVELIQKYAQRMRSYNIETMVLDASIFKRNFINRFDYVLADVPCSGFGVIAKRPDIAMNRTESDIAELTDIQYKILTNSSEYLKVGGALVYSTCTVLKEENGDIIHKFLNEHKNFKLEKMDIPFTNNGEYQFLPEEGLDGFYLARLVKYE